MPPRLLVEYQHLDFDNPLIDIEGIRELLPQRYEMEQLTAVVHVDEEEGGRIVGYRDVRDDEFWVRGHLPERPLVPGVVLCEMGAQLAAVLEARLDTGTNWDTHFRGFAGLEGVKFRRAVVPGDRIVLLGKCGKFTRRLSTVFTQGFVNDKLAFEATIHGSVMPRTS
ncbi:MAG: 3-hydroxyacyl-ACP dehydratase FabZ family protein [Planctomycetota bacterium]